MMQAYTVTPSGVYMTDSDAQGRGRLWVRMHRLTGVQPDVQGRQYQLDILGIVSWGVHSVHPSEAEALQVAATLEYDMENLS